MANKKRSKKVHARKGTKIHMKFASSNSQGFQTLIVTDFTQ